MALRRKLDSSTPNTWGGTGFDHEVVNLATVDYAPSDGGLFDGLYVGGAGNVTFTSPAGNSVTWNSVPAGTIIPMAGSLVTKATTTATNIVAIFL